MNHVASPQDRYERPTAATGLFSFDLTGLRHSGLRRYYQACLRAVDGEKGEVRSGLEATQALLRLHPTRQFCARLASTGEISACGRSARYWHGALVIAIHIPAGNTVTVGDGGTAAKYPHFIQVLMPWGAFSFDCYDAATRILPLRNERFARSAFLLALSVAEATPRPTLACSPPIAVTPGGLRHGWL